MGKTAMSGLAIVSINLDPPLFANLQSSLTSIVRHVGHGERQGLSLNQSGLVGFHEGRAFFLLSAAHGSCCYLLNLSQF